jgi:hypothetical protein
VKEEAALKISMGIPSERIMEDIREDIGNGTKREEFEQFAARKHFITKQDITNASRRVKDCSVIRHQSDPLSVAEVVAGLQEEPYDPVLLYKAQGENDPTSQQMDSS